jgi:hypothetical protein
MKLQHGSVLAMIMLLACMDSRAEEPQPWLSFFPGKKIYPAQTADALTHQISLSRVTNNHDWIGTIGGSIPLAQARVDSTVMQVSTAVSTFNRLISPPGLTVYTVDFKVDFPLDVRIGATALRFSLGHYSCHFADDGIELLGKRSIQYIKDYYTLGAARDLPIIGGHAYGVIHWVHHNVPMRSRNWALQLGGEAGNVDLNAYVRLYAAIDLKYKQEVAWGSTQSYQVGARLLINGDRTFRVAYTFRRGLDERGQFFDTREDIGILSAFVDF